MKTFIIHVSGMHCSSCPMLIESTLLDLPEIANARASLKYQHVEVTGAFDEKTIEDVARELTEVVKQHGYALSSERNGHLAQWHDFLVAIPLAVICIALFIALQKLGIVNLVSASNVSYGTAFVIGLIASVSTCMAVVGGLVLSLSANFAKGGDRVRPQMVFHAGRLISFFIFGGIVGALGAAFQLGVQGIFVLGLVVAFTLLVLGINLLDIFPSMKKLQPTLPNFLGKNIHGLKKLNHTLTPLLLGLATFFLPCGFTQSMQIYTLTTGNFWTGAFTMSAFALGTLPVLALLSFTSLAIHSKAKSSVFFKTAGLVVVFFGLLNLITSLTAVGYIPPIFNF